MNTFGCSNFDVGNSANVFDPGCKNLRVLHTEWSMGWGGQEIRILSEMVAFRDLGVTMEIACRKGSQIGCEAGKLKFPIHYLPFAGRLDFTTIIGLRQLIRRGGFSLLHTHSSIDSWCGGIAGFLFNLPVIRSRHTSALVRPGINARIVYDFFPAAVISSGDYIRNHFVDVCHFQKRKHFSVPAGACPTLFSPEVDSSSVRSEFSLNGAFPIIGIVAVLRSWKGHHILFKACANILDEYPNLRILVVGEGPSRDRLRALTKDLKMENHVVFTGHRDDVPACMKVMDVCVLPSTKNEATSQVMPQAMLVGTPVICSAAGGLTEIVRDRVTGRVVPPSDAKALEAALRETILDHESAISMAERARKFARENITFSKQISSTLNVYKWVLSQS